MYSVIEEYIRNNNNKVIAIDGPSGVGKSSLAKYLEENFDVLVFHTDDYFLQPEDKTILRLNEVGGNIDYERMEKEIFSNLNSTMIQSNYFNCKTNTLEMKNPQPKKPIIIVEGVYSMHPRFVDYYDFKVFLDINRNTQLKRILDRSGPVMYPRFVKEWIPMEDKYFDVFELRNKADLYIKNT